VVPLPSLAAVNPADSSPRKTGLLVERAEERREGSSKSGAFGETEAVIAGSSQGSPRKTTESSAIQSTDPSAVTTPSPSHLLQAVPAHETGVFTPAGNEKVFFTSASSSPSDKTSPLRASMTSPAVNALIFEGENLDDCPRALMSLDGQKFKDCNALFLDIVGLTQEELFTKSLFNLVKFKTFLGNFTKKKLGESFIIIPCSLVARFLCFCFGPLNFTHSLDLFFSRASRGGLLIRRIVVKRRQD
jgi:hypothetical protein